MVKTQMDVVSARSNVNFFPGFVPEEKKPSRILAVTHWLGITMPNPERPSGWQLNPATVTLIILIAGLVAGGAYYVGKRDAESEHLLRKLEQIEKTAQQAKDLSLSKASQIGHETNENAKK